MKNKNELIKELIEYEGTFILFDNLEECLLNAREVGILEEDIIKDLIKDYKKGQLILWHDNPMDWGDYYLLDNMCEVFEKIADLDNDFIITLLNDFYNLIDKENE